MKSIKNGDAPAGQEQPSNKKGSKWDSADKVIATSLAAGFALMICRVTLVGFVFDLRSIPTMVVVSYYDFMVLGALGAVAVFLVAVSGTRKAIWLARLHLSLVTFVVIFGLVNIKIDWNIGQPLTYSWLVYSDFLSGPTARTAIEPEITTGTIAYGLVVMFLFFAVRYFLVRFFRVLAVVVQNQWTPASAISLVGAIYFPVVGIHLSHTDWIQDKLQNPAWVLFRSCIASRDEFVAAQNSNLTAGEDPAAKPATFAAIWGDRPAAPKNVIFFVMESVGAKYLKLCGGRYPVTPTLSAYRSSAIQFENIFASCPQTDKSTVSLLCGIYPSASHRGITKDYPDLDVSSLSGILKARSYRTAWFNGGDLLFANCGGFLAHRGFDLVEDCFQRQEHCPIKTGQNADGSCDDCTVGSMMDWILADTNRPFFTVIWTAQTHVPYWLCGKEQAEFGPKNRCFNRYLNAITESDSAFALLMKNLEWAHLADNTLVIVVGDHGEVFHDESRDLMGLHANNIHDGNIHVPCLFINGRLFHGQKSDAVGGLLDLPATVLDVLGIGTPKGWQGTSLFSQHRSDGEFLYTSVGRDLFGYRDANMEWIYNPQSGTWEVFDMRNDPMEKHNLASVRQQECAGMKLKMLDWVRQQQSYVLRHLPAVTVAGSGGVSRTQE